MNSQQSKTRGGLSRRNILAAGAVAAAVTGLASTPVAAAPGDGNAKTRGQVLFHEDFEDIVRPTGFTHDAPKGWTNEANGFRTGEGRWSGWTFTDVREWTWAVGTAERHWFTGGFGTFAVLESEHHRLDQESDDMLNATLTTPRIQLRGNMEIELAFDSHYKQGRAAQSAAVTVAFDDGPPQDLVVFQEDRYTSHEQLRVTAPEGASSVRFAWEYRAGHNDKWWAIDNIEVRVPLPELAEDAEPLTTVDVISDVHVSDSTALYDEILGQLNALEPAAGALVINGDVVERGKQAHFDTFASALTGSPHASGNVLVSVGNHEMLGDEGSDVYVGRYLEVAGEKTPYFERVVDGLPVLVTGTEYYGDREREGREPYNNFTDAQLEWLDQRLEHWRRKDQPVLLFNHFPLPYTVSQTHSSWEQNNYEDIERFNAVVGKYGHILMFTSHTHSDLSLHDWWGTYRIADPKAPAGFPVVNTGSVYYTTVPDGDVESTRTDGENSTGLRVHRYEDRLRVEAYDFVTQQVTKFQDFAMSALSSRP